ncbi:family 20 glycosylhydrolase [Dactylosporangium sp. NPDC000555]|uniref:family 20 glycosylhydrolase n=1 Tax=Dactylosporangium sp. NPDC000555 TaxID=3154260 RepID=UPI00332C24D6
MNVIPVPAQVFADPSVTFTLRPDATIRSDSAFLGEYLAEFLRRSTGYALPVVDRLDAAIELALTHAADRPDAGDRPDTSDRPDASDRPPAGDGPTPSPAAIGNTRSDISDISDFPDESYTVEVTAERVTIRGRTEAGLFYGVQTLLQLMPSSVDAHTVQDGPWTVPGGRIADRPRYAYRGAMLDVSRHFFGVEVLKRFVDRLSRYKMNVLHLHLSDDQGWRIAVDAWPRLATVGGASQVGGGPGGHYTKAQYAELVAYAAARHVTLVPEIDMPGHVNAALTAYPELNRDGVAPPPYTGVEVGFSTLRADLDVTYTFVRQVLEEVVALTPGPYVHIGGDEALSTSPEDYRAFMNRVQPLVTAAGKTVVGWHQIGAADREPGRIAQYWGNLPDPDDDMRAALAQGDRILLTPANRVYLDMKYDAGTRIGLDWAGHITVRTAYDWDPATLLPGRPDIIGIEAPLWTETVETEADIDLLTFPRLPAVAEVAWSPQPARDWPAFRARLATHGPRWTHWGVGFHPDPEIPWP